MEKEEITAKQKEFIQTMFVDEIGRLQKEGFYLFSYILMGQALEALGSFLDKKPMKATGQSAKRFSKALNWLMGDRYRLLNEKHWFFDKFRSQLTHAFAPSKSLLLTNRADAPEGVKHLGIHNKQVVLIAEDMYADFTRGCKKMCKLIDQGKAFPQKIGEV